MRNLLFLSAIALFAFATCNVSAQPITFIMTGEVGSDPNAPDAINGNITGNDQWFLNGTLLPAGTFMEFRFTIDLSIASSIGSNNVGVFQGGSLTVSIPSEGLLEVESALAYDLLFKDLTVRDEVTFAPPSNNPGMFIEAHWPPGIHPWPGGDPQNLGLLDEPIPPVSQIRSAGDGQGFHELHLSTGDVLSSERMLFANGAINQVGPQTIVESFDATGENTVVSDTQNLAAGTINWYEIDYDGVGRLVIDTIGTSFDTEFGLFNYAGELIAENNDFANPFLLQSRLVFDESLSAGTYYLAIGGNSTDFANEFNATTSSSLSGPVIVNVSTFNFGTTKWTGLVDNFFGESFNWDSVEPESTLDTVFDLPDTYTVNLTQDEASNSLRILDGSVALSGNQNYDINSGGVFINGGDLTLENSLNLSYSGGDLNHRNGDLTLAGGSQLNNVGTYNLGFNALSNIDVGVGSAVSSGQLRIFDGTVSIGENAIWDSSGTFGVGRASGKTGNLDISLGGVVNSAFGLVANEANSFGNVTIDGMDSAWNLSGTTFQIGNVGDADIQIQNQGTLSSNGAEVARNSNSQATITVDGADSNWTDSANIYLGGTATGSGGTASLNVQNSGLVEIGGTTKLWNGATIILDNTGNLSVDGPVQTSGMNTASLELAGGLVTVNGTTSIGSLGAVSLNGGRFEFGTMSPSDIANVTATSGEMAGEISFTGLNNVADYTALQVPGVDVSEVNAFNFGVLYGSAFLGVVLQNEVGGELRAFESDWVRFEGDGSVNAGEINNFGGVVEFEGDLVNEFNGIIAGRGLFFFDGGLTNNGGIGFSGEFADVLGKIDNSLTGMIAVGGNCLATFYDDVEMLDTMNNPDVQVAGSSTAVFFGSFNGGNSGSGTCEIFGDLRPGNSPAAVFFGGDLSLGNSATTEIELGGLIAGDEYDQLNVAGDLSLSGALNVVLINGFVTSPGQQFTIAQIGGNLSGTFDGLSEGATLPGTDLTITYAGGDGNDIVLLADVACTPGDVNMDGSINLLDVDPFIAAIASGTYQCEADTNEDGVVNLLDVDPFIVIIAGGG